MIIRRTGTLFSLLIRGADHRALFGRRRSHLWATLETRDFRGCRWMRGWKRHGGQRAAIGKTAAWPGLTDTRDAGMGTSVGNAAGASVIGTPTDRLSPTRPPPCKTRSNPGCLARILLVLAGCAQQGRLISIKKGGPRVICPPLLRPSKAHAPPLVAELSFSVHSLTRRPTPADRLQSRLPPRRPGNL